MYTLLPAHQIALRVAELGRTIGNAYRGKPLTILGVLNGSVIMVADLMRSIEVPHRIGFVHASSYAGKTTESGSLSVELSLMPDIEGRDVLLVDDIFDTGKTLVRLLDELRAYRPASSPTLETGTQRSRANSRLLRLSNPQRLRGWIRPRLRRRLSPSAQHRRSRTVRPRLAAC